MARNSTSGEQKRWRTVMFLLSHHPSFTMIATPPPHVLLDSSVLSDRKTERVSAGLMEWSAFDGSNQVSLKISTLQCLMSRSHANRSRRSSTFSSFKDWTLATRTLGKDGLLNRSLKAYLTPPRLPLCLVRGLFCPAVFVRMSAGRDWTHSSEGFR